MLPALQQLLDVLQVGRDLMGLETGCSRAPLRPKTWEQRISPPPPPARWQRSGGYSLEPSAPVATPGGPVRLTPAAHPHSLHLPKPIASPPHPISCPRLSFPQSLPFSHGPKAPSPWEAIPQPNRSHSQGALPEIQPQCPPAMSALHLTRHYHSGSPRPPHGS